MPREDRLESQRPDLVIRSRGVWRTISRGAGVALTILSLAAIAACTSTPDSGTSGPAAKTAAEPDHAKVEAEEADEAPQGPGIAYTSTIEGVDDASLLSLLEESSQLLALESRPPETLAGLQRRARRDLERLSETLRSEGYYGSTLDFAIDEDATPVAVTLQIEPGPQYRLTEYEIIYSGDTPPEAADRPGLEDLGLEIGGAARAPTILAAQQRLIDRLVERGYPLAKIEERKTFVQHAARTMTARLTVDAGPMAHFGPLTITGAENVDDAYLRRLVTWEEGARFDRREIEATRRAMTNTGLFTSVRVMPAAEVDESGALPVNLELAEGPQRSIGAGVSYSTDIGFGAEVFWEHRNFFGANERLKLTISGAEIEQKAEADFRKPAFRRPDQALLARISFANERTDAFDGQTVGAYLGLERPWLENWLITAGTSFDFDDLDDNKDKQKSWVVGLPVTGVRDLRDDRLNPTRGTQLDLGLTPYAGIGDANSLVFVSSQAQGRAYQALDDDRRFVLAGRLKVGSIVGERRRDLPANKRFYAGGGGSIRGFEFQKVGPLDGNDDPIGGRSLFEASGELRYRVTESWGAVTFVDGGNVFDSVVPDFERQLRWAAGLGVRYFTGFGPFRVDVAFPLNGRQDVDDTFEFYVSFGQAF